MSELLLPAQLYNARFEYAWKYFEFHAKQRTVMFNFFLVFTGFFISGCIQLWGQEFFGMLLGALVFGILLTFMFIFLERRNEELVHVAEDILFELEKSVLFKDFKADVSWPNQRNWYQKLLKDEKKNVLLGIFIRERGEDFPESKNQHGIWVFGIQFMIISMYFLALIFVLFKL